jgi:hypothetical protein
MWFIEELKKLRDSQPRIALVNTDSFNSEYANYAYKNKNCYLLFGSHYNEDSMHCQYIWKAHSSMDCDDVTKSELCYECSYASGLYDCNYCWNCFTCAECEYSFDLVNCKNCFLSCGLRNTEYYIENEKFSPEEYKKRVEQLKKQYSSRELLAKREKVREKTPHVASIQKNCEDCVGSFMESAKGCFWCFNTNNAEDCMYMYTSITNVKDSMDCVCIGYDPSELLYQCVGNNGNHNCNFCDSCWHSSDLEYCEMVFNSHDCFGCISRSHAEYEILNKKYPKEEYFKKVAEIKDELRKEGLYGKWLLESSYPYEDTIAPLYYE